jgi:hypothetical protein
MVQEAGAVSVQDTYEQGYAEGTAAALGTNTNTAMMVGCGSTCVFFLVGACGSWATYRFLVPVGEVPLDTSSHSPEYREGFEDGYNKAVRKARSKAALTGAVPALLLGTLAISMATLLG